MKPFLFFCLLLLSAFTLPAQDTLRTTVSRVVDGDTYWVLSASHSGILKVRLAGIDCPEQMGYVKKDQPFGREIADSCRSWLIGKPVTVITYGLDPYGRTIGRIYYKGVDITLDELRSGWGWYYSSDGVDKKTRRAYQAARDYAKKNKIGIWSDPLVENPKLWRKLYAVDDKPKKVVSVADRFIFIRK